MQRDLLLRRVSREGITKEERKQINDNKINPPDEQKKILIEKDIELMKLEDEFKNIQQDQLANILNMYSKDNDHRIQKKRQKMLQLVKKLKEEKKDKKEQIDLLDSKMRLYYLIREYAKETQGVEQLDNYTEEVFDLGFFDQLRAKQRQKNENIRDKFLRRKLLVKHFPGDGDLAEANSDDSNFMDEELEEKIKFGLGFKGSLDNRIPEGINQLPLIKVLYQKQKNLEQELEEQEIKQQLTKGKRTSTMKLRFKEQPNKSTKVIDSKLKCKYCQDKDKGIKNLKGKCICDKKQKDYDKVQLNEAMRKKIFGLDDLKRMNTKTLEYLDSELKTQQVQKQNYELALKKRKILNTKKPPLIKQLSKISDAQTDFTNTLQPKKQNPIKNALKISPRKIDSKTSARASQQLSNQKQKQILPEIKKERLELRKRQANEIQTQTNDSLFINGPNNNLAGLKGIPKMSKDVINEIKRQVKEELKFELQQQEIVEDESDQFSQYKSSPVKLIRRNSVRLSPLRLEKPIIQTPVPVSSEYRKPPLPMPQNHLRAHSQNQLELKSNLLRIKPLESELSASVRPFSQENQNQQHKSSFAGSTQANTNKILNYEGNSSKIPLSRAHFKTVIEPIPDEGELKLDDKNEENKSRNIDQYVKQVTVSIFNEKTEENDKIKDYMNRGYLKDEEKIFELKLPDSPTKIQSSSNSPDDENRKHRQSEFSYEGNSVFKKSMQYWHQTVKPTKLPKVSARKHLELELLEQKNLGTVVLRVQRFHLSDLV
ncbi:UNKNOWN [Stylonychia lemnae]|uniref:Uncharacterized protein n=1 Tax=Stylonychia lemnae TaxID=5949 RepID=A0A078A943_STYLE|nr:UNKNOWN [Stylonychia lemnae]|eukprot:CDW78795.1 UNKNOWN [Stylonychia lemnae]